jgi:hypothetical protein
MKLDSFGQKWSLILSSAKKFENDQPQNRDETQHMKKAGRGWLHTK